jgi:hypothetical protein
MIIVTRICTTSHSYLFIYVCYFFILQELDSVKDDLSRIKTNNILNATPNLRKIDKRQSPQRIITPKKSPLFKGKIKRLLHSKYHDKHGLDLTTGRLSAHTSMMPSVTFRRAAGMLCLRICTYIYLIIDVYIYISICMSFQIHIDRSISLFVCSSTYMYVYMYV